MPNVPDQPDTREPLAATQGGRRVPQCLTCTRRRVGYYYNNNNSIILVESQIDAGSLIQVERNQKALRRIQEKIMCAKSTLDWSQSNNISCFNIKHKIKLHYTRNCHPMVNVNVKHNDESVDVNFSPNSICCNCVC